MSPDLAVQFLASAFVAGSAMGLVARYLRVRG